MNAASQIIGVSVDITASAERHGGRPSALCARKEPEEVYLPRAIFGGWTLRRVYLYAGAVRFIWRCPLGSEYGMSGNHDEREALLTALRWWKLRAAQIERNRGALLQAFPPTHSSLVPRPSSLLPA